MKSILEWILSILIAVILLQTLYFKFTGHPESVYIFTQVGMEPWGRIGSGVVELIASILILLPRFRVYGALLTCAVMSGAIFFHLTRLGIEIMEDGGQLFLYALVAFLCGLVVVVLRRKEIPWMGDKL